MRAPRGIRGLMAVAACVGLPLLLAGMAGTAGASPPSEPRVLSSGLVFSEPDADGHFAAWGAVDTGGGRGIYLWNLDTDEETSIAEESGTPHVAGGLVVWERRLGDEVEIVCYQIATGRSAVISRGEGWHHLLCAQGGRVVWSTLVGGETQAVQLWIWDQGSRQSRMIAESGGTVAADLDGDLLAYTLGHDIHAELFLHDLTTGLTTQLTHDDVFDDRPLIDGGIIAWHSFPAYATETEVMVMDLGSRVARRLTHTESGERLCGVEDGRVCWVGQERKGTDVFLWEQETDEVRRVSVDPFNESHCRLVGDWLAWPAAGSGSWADEVVLHHIPSGITKRITDDTVPDHCPVVADGHLLWLRGHAEDQTVMCVEFDASHAPTPDASAFSDIASSPYRSAVEALAREGAVGGFPDGSYRPDETLTRAQFIKMLIEALRIPVSEDLTAYFWDLGTDDLSTLYPHDYIAAAYREGIVTGVTPTSFAPWTAISRAQLVTTMIRAARGRSLPIGSCPLDFHPTLGSFDSVHGASMAIAECNGVMAGITDFGPGWDPWRPATRGEAACLLWYAIYQ